MAKTVQELTDISIVLRDSLFTSQLTKAEIFMVMGLLQAMVSARVASGEPNNKPTNVQTPLEPIREKVKDVKYDPLYDPAPPMESEPLPARPDTKGKVLSENGSACACASCGKVGYITNRPIIDGMKVSEFIEAFTAMEGYPPITRQISIQNIEGNISIDCPRCKAQKKLFLVGREPAHESGVDI